MIFIKKGLTYMYLVDMSNDYGDKIMNDEESQISFLLCLHCVSFFLGRPQVVQKPGCRPSPDVAAPSPCPNVTSLAAL